MGPSPSIIENKKIKIHGKSKYFQFGGCSIQNKQFYRNGRIVSCEKPSETTETTETGDSDIEYGFFAVLQGADSLFNSNNSDILKDSLLKSILRNERKKGSSSNQMNFLRDDFVLESAFFDLDRELFDKTDEKITFKNIHTELVSVFIVPRSSFRSMEIICSNIGRPRAIHFNYFERKGSSEIVSSLLSVEHVPSMEEEKERIIKAGGNIINECLSYDNGMFSVSRAFGLFNTKENKELDQDEQMVIVKPEISRILIRGEQDAEYSFIVLGTSRLFTGFYLKDDNENAKDMGEMIVKMLKEQESGIYYQNEEKRSRERLGRYTNEDVSNLEYQKLEEKTNEVYDIDAICGEVVDYYSLTRGVVDESLSLVIILLKSRKGELHILKDEKERVDFLKTVSFEISSPTLKFINNEGINIVIPKFLIQ